MARIFITFLLFIFSLNGLLFGECSINNLKKDRICDIQKETCLYKLNKTEHKPLFYDCSLIKKNDFNIDYKPICIKKIEYNISSIYCFSNKLLLTAKAVTISKDINIFILRLII
ncbi:MAG: hypothetical protein A2X02_05445 [Bacteroidetes bacterium GWF2_29_10]|nr:MAG: hypothetical protein A2X02_05445 [Bacteroidetes bacterium GWF2_29_10]